MKITTQEQLTKAAKTLVEHIGKLQEVHKAAGVHMKKAHEAVEAKHEAVGEHIEKCMKAAKDAAEGEEPEEAGKVAADPAVAKKLDELEKSIAALTDKLSKTPAPGGPHTGAGVDLDKAAIPAGLESVVNTAPVVTH
jgi:seryl-tRNA synthetase